jgi:hypothetical protein
MRGSPSVNLFAESYAKPARVSAVGSGYGYAMGNKTYTAFVIFAVILVVALLALALI